MEGADGVIRAYGVVASEEAFGLKGLVHPAALKEAVGTLLVLKRCPSPTKEPLEIAGAADPLPEEDAPAPPDLIDTPEVAHHTAPLTDPGSLEVAGGVGRRHPSTLEEALRAAEGFDPGGYDGNGIAVIVDHELSVVLEIRERYLAAVERCCDGEGVLEFLRRWIGKIDDLEQEAIDMVLRI